MPTKTSNFPKSCHFSITEWEENKISPSPWFLFLCSPGMILIFSYLHWPQLFSELCESGLHSLPSCVYTFYLRLTPASIPLETHCWWHTLSFNFGSGSAFLSVPSLKSCVPMSRVLGWQVSGVNWWCWSLYWLLQLQLRSWPFLWLLLQGRPLSFHSPCFSQCVQMWLHPKHVCCFQFLT